MKKKHLKAALVLSFLLLLFLFPKAALDGAKSGLLLWFYTVLPTLLPFMIVSNLIIQLDITGYISKLLYPVLHKLLGISSNGCYPVLIGMLSGYPVGAKACADMVLEKKITKKEGQFLLSFCNNASPMFILSFIALQSLGITRQSYLLLGIILLSALLSSLMYRFIFTVRYSDSAFPKKMKPYLKVQSSEQGITIFQLLDASIINAFEVLVKVGGYIILFSILAQMVASISILPLMLRLTIIGLLEITTGANTIAAAPIDHAKKIVLITALTAFGGFSSLTQTKSVVADSGLSIRIYLAVKCLNAAIAAALAAFLVHIL